MNIPQCFLGSSSRTLRSPLLPRAKLLWRVFVKLDAVSFIINARELNLLYVEITSGPNEHLDIPENLDNDRDGVQRVRAQRPLSFVRKIWTASWSWTISPVRDAASFIPTHDTLTKASFTLHFRTRRNTFTKCPIVDKTKLHVACGDG
jgi:hypothetical protein